MIYYVASKQHTPVWLKGHSSGSKACFQWTENGDGKWIKNWIKNMYMLKVSREERQLFVLLHQLQSSLDTKIFSFIWSVLITEYSPAH